jgi:hypothetical protein
MYGIPQTNPNAPHVQPMYMMVKIHIK